MKLSKIKLCILFLLIICFYQHIYSQQIGCPPGSENWHTGSYTYSLEYYSASGNVSYSSQNNGQDNTDMKIDWSTLNVNNASTTNESGWKKAMEQNLVKQIVVANAPHQEGYQWTVNNYYEKYCSTQTKFVYDLDVTTTVLCCSDANIGQWFYDHWENGVFHKLMNVYKNIVCGTKCCRRQYICTMHYEPLYYYWYASIDQIQTYSETTCSGDSGNIDCVSHLPTPCIDGSCDD